MNATYQEKFIKSKIGLLKLGEELQNVAHACRTLGYSRDTFYRYKKLYAEGGIPALTEKTRRKPCMGNRVSLEIETRALQYAYDFPTYGPYRVSHELRLQGIFVSPGGVRSIWIRNNLKTAKDRVAALEARSAKEGLVLTEYQKRLLERAREEKIAYGEIETEHPGYLLAQDTYYVGIIKGVGRVYQQTVIDTYSRVAFAKLYTHKTAIAAAEILNDRVVPWFEEQQVPILRILTDRGTEYNGKDYEHPYELYLRLLEVDHSRTKAYSPQTNGICERFQQTLKNEFYEITFRKKIYETLEELQQDLDVWLEEYNKKRAHSGKYCYGKTPWQTFTENRSLVESKDLNMLHQPVRESLME